MTTKYDKNSSMALKGIAIIIMMFHHCFMTVDRFENYSVSSWPFNIETIAKICNMGKICVAIFAFISGYGLLMSYNRKNINASKWVYSRIIKTLGGFWIISALSMIVCQIIDGRVSDVYYRNVEFVKGTVYLITDFLGLSSLFNTPTLCGTWWYMSIAIVFIVMVPLLAKFQENLWLVLITVIILPRILNADILGKSNFASFFSAFIIGMIAFKYDLVNRWLQIWNTGIKKVLKFIIMIGVLYICYLLYTQTSAVTYCELRWGLIPFVFILFFVEFITDLPLIKKILYFIGKHSMNIFLIHTFYRQYYLKDFIYSFPHVTIVVFALLLISLVTSVLLEVFKKIIKYDEWIKKLCDMVNAKT